MNLNYSLLICGYNIWKSNVRVPEPFISFNENTTVGSSENKNFYIMISTENEGIRWREPTENLNRATHNSPIRLSTFQINEKIIPEIILSEINDTENFDVLSKCLKETLHSKVVWGGLKNQNPIETLSGMLQGLNALGSSVILKSTHLINEEMDRKDFINSFEARYTVH